MNEGIYTNVYICIIYPGIPKIHSGMMSHTYIVKNSLHFPGEAYIALLMVNYGISNTAVLEIP